MDIAMIVEKLAAFNLLRADRIRGNWYTIYCPFHNNGQERKPSCGVSLQDEYRAGKLFRAGSCHCFACGAVYSLPDMVTELLRLKNVPQDGRDWLTENIPGFDASAAEFEKLIPDELAEEITNQFALADLKRLAMEKQPVYVSEEELATYRYNVDYMYQRKLTDELIEKFDIGFDQNHVPPGRKHPVPCITMPVRDRDGNTLFICRRSIEGKYFNYPRDVEKPVYGLYELPKGCKSIIICESILNAITCYRYGKPAVALLGTGTPYQIQQLKELGVTEFILGLDPDEAGRKGTAKLKKALSSVAIVWEYENIPEGKDINDLTEEEFNALTLA